MTKRKKVNPIEKAIISYCKDNDTYIKGVTNKLISDLILNLELQNDAEADLKSRGLMIDVSTSDVPYYQVNPSKNIIHECIKTSQSILRQLAISPDQILKMKKGDVEQPDLTDVQAILYR